MAEVTFETTVQKTVIEVEDMTGTPVNVEPTPEVSFNVENGNAGGGGGYIDTTELAKQGDDQDATNTAIYNAVNTLLSRSVKYDEDTGNLTIENVELTINE